jgi:carbon monoxide dehydrogenase subunit G
MSPKVNVGPNAMMTARMCRTSQKLTSSTWTSPIVRSDGTYSGARRGKLQPLRLGEANVRILERVTLDASPVAVWSVLTDWERQASWMPDVAWLRVIGPGRQLGARIEVRTRVLGIPLATDLVEVTTWEPPRRLAVRHTGVVAGTGEWALATGPEGGTAFTWTEVIRMPPPVLGDLALWLYGPIQRWMLRRAVRNLGRLLDRSG